VAFALIKTEKLDETGKTRIKREVQAMGKLGDHPNIVAIYDMGDHEGQQSLRGRVVNRLNPVPSNSLTLTGRCGTEAAPSTSVRGIVLMCDFCDPFYVVHDSCDV
jgi:serine/threonine protein kinase